ncbi:DNA-3-methyladenine glycosylase III [Thiohalospira halophila DSM 15071]|uniref:DNA-3-methyladenine glycosylase III n=1 Tax=Thiohalospira halophila DSM 15071 TaxID=1123397 RepID=A0A1I1NIA5_9GAMM|nr:endonuclease [Thiohalospira halophila]SFC97371.1 DNA-3-methyladenine glycosylase III [Thiohalospira halophila DSM 15071]
MSNFRTVFDTLLAAHGPQDWWPAEEGAFEVMVGAVLTQNAAWTNVERAIANLREAGALDPEAILAADHDDLGGWIRPSGYFNVKADRLRALCRWYLDAGGYHALARWPTEDLRTGLLSVKGVGRETADDILLYAFHRPVFVIDAYTRRIFARLGLVTGEEGYEALRETFEAALAEQPEPVALFNEYHALIVAHGKDICRPRPRCSECVLVQRCSHAEPVPEMAENA